jgi:hypothetical protein
MKTKAATVLLLLSALFAIAADRDEAKYSSDAEATAKKLSERIKTEITGLTNHPWAGEYHYGDGLGVNVTFVIAPENGYVFEWYGCGGLYDRNYGSVTASDGLLRLSVTFRNERKGFQGMAQELIPVPWGDRHYLIPADDVIGFCNHVNCGSEPRTARLGYHLLRSGDEKKPVSGFPSVPADYRPYLLASPITAEITGIRSVTTRPSVSDWKFKDTTVTLDAGTNKVLRRGMELHVSVPADLVESVIITKVAETTAEAMMTQIGADERGPEKGWRVSTRCRWEEDKAPIAK